MSADQATVRLRALSCSWAILDRAFCVGKDCHYGSGPVMAIGMRIHSIQRSGPFRGFHSQAVCS